MFSSLKISFREGHLGGQGLPPDCQRTEEPPNLVQTIVSHSLQLPTL